MNDVRFWGLSTRALVGLAFATVVVAIQHIAHADLPRPDGWKPTCTIEIEQQKGGGPCEDVHGWADPDPRQDALKNKGYTKRCTEGGAGSFVAVYCKSAAGSTDAPKDAPTTTPNATATPTTPPTVAPAADNRKSGGMCTIHAFGPDNHDAPLAGLVFLGAMLGLVRRGRSSGTANRRA